MKAKSESTVRKSRKVSAETKKSPVKRALKKSTGPTEDEIRAKATELYKERITKNKGFIEYPHYTRPEVFEPKKRLKWRVPKVLLSGHHKNIQEWRTKRGKEIEK